MSNDHIPSSEIRQDIADTRAEIEIMKREATGLSMMSDRMSHFRADARLAGIKEREEFIRKLEDILVSRGESP